MLVRALNAAEHAGFKHNVQTFLSECLYKNVTNRAECSSVPGFPNQSQCCLLQFNTGFRNKLLAADLCACNRGIPAAVKALHI